MTALVQDAEGFFAATTKLSDLRKKSQDAAFRRLCLIAAFSPNAIIRQRARDSLHARFNIVVQG